LRCIALRVLQRLTQEKAVLGEEQFLALVMEAHPNDVARGVGRPEWLTRAALSKLTPVVAMVAPRPEHRSQNKRKTDKAQL
jgi:hypothetical protein